MNTYSARPAQAAIPGRGASVNPPNRFERLQVERDPDCPEEERPHPRTEFFFDASESILVLFGTGMRTGNTTGSTVNVGSMALTALYAGPVSGLIGLDQVNSVELPRALIGRKDVNVFVIVGGKTSNTVRVVIQ